jgi:hypothetical protein
MFRGFTLIKLNKAVGISSDAETKCDYEVTVVDVLGRVHVKVMKLSQIERDFCKLRMSGDRCAKLAGGVVEIISEEEFDRLSAA